MTLIFRKQFANAMVRDQLTLSLMIVVLYTDLAHGSYNGPSRETAARPASSTRPRSSGGIWALVWPVLAVRPRVCHHK